MGKPAPWESDAVVDQPAQQPMGTSDAPWSGDHVEGGEQPSVAAAPPAVRNAPEPKPLYDGAGHVILQDANAIPQGQDTGIIGEEGGSHTEANPKLAGANAAVEAMIKAGVPNEKIVDYLKQRGASDQYLLGIMPQLVKIREFQAQNPHYKGDYLVDLEHEQVPNSVLQNVMGSDVGAGLTAAGDASTAFALPEIAGLAGADPNEVQTAIQASEAMHPKSALAGTVAGGAAGTLGIEEGLARTGVKGLARAAPEAAEGVAALSPVIRPLTADALYGGAAGAVTAEGEDGKPATALDRLIAAGEGAGAALAGHVSGQLATGAARGTARYLDNRDANLAANQDFAAAADRQGIDYMAADLPKATKSKFATALSALTLGGIPLADQGERNIGTGRAAVGRVASDVGGVADKTGAGQAAQRGANQFLTDTDAKMGTLYDAVPIPSDASANVSSTRAALLNAARSFRSNPKLNAAFQNPQISKYLDALTPQTAKEPTGLFDAAGNPITRDVEHGGGLSWADLKDFRTRIGKIIGQPGLTSDGQQISELRGLYGALSDDMRATAANYGPQAASAFERANTYARARANRIDNVVSLILGKNNDKAPQSAFEALQRLGNEKGGDPIKLAQALRSMPTDEANSIRATILDDMGRASAGRQNDVGDVFSPDQFVTNWNKISDRAKSVLFTGEHRAALDDIAKVLSGMKASAKFANTSKTGIGVVAATHTVPAMLSNPLLGAMDMIAQYGGGKLLASPRFAKWVSGLAKKPNANARLEHVQRLGGIAMAEPEMAGDIRSLQQRLSDSFRQGLKSDVTKRALTASGAASGAALAAQQ